MAYLKSSSKFQMNMLHLFERQDVFDCVAIAMIAFSCSFCARFASMFALQAQLPGCKNEDKVVAITGHQVWSDGNTIQQR